MTLLLEKGANVEAPSESGTALLWAAGSGSVDIVAQLLEKGADPDAQTLDGVSASLMAAAAGMRNSLLLATVCSLRSLFLGKTSKQHMPRFSSSSNRQRPTKLNMLLSCCCE